LEPITWRTPKPLLRILGKTLIDWESEELRSAGVERVTVLAASSRKSQFNECGIMDLLEQRQPRGTADAASSAMTKIHEELYLQYGDNLLSKNAIERILRSGRDRLATVGCVRVDDPGRYGVVHARNDGTLEYIEEKPERPSSNLVMAGAFRFKPEFLSYLDKVTPSARGELELTDALSLAAKKNEVGVVEINKDDWTDITFPWDLLKLNASLLKTHDSEILGTIEEGVRIRGPLILGRGSTIRSGSYIEGPVWIGSGVTIGPNAYLRPFSSIDNYSHLGNACEIKASILGQRVRVGHLSYVGDSVISDDVNLGAGTITANLRFDSETVKVVVNGSKVDTGMVKLGSFIGPGVKTGVNVSINPGIRIGADAWVSPGKVVENDVQPEARYS
jgi:bifunctional UDP-N-acetylglucosamine pyrophosphorylase/glucosamine-1-phosphate N-acetyltransferase